MSDSHSIKDKAAQEWREDTEGGAPADLVQLAAAYVPGSAEEKAFVRKIDRRIIPTIWGLYVLSYLDRANIGNAKTGGLQADFNLTSQQYSIVLLVFFISYVLFEIPSNLLIARIRPSFYLSGLCILWGGVAASMAAARNWHELTAIRFALGIAEAGFAPGVAFYLSSWYKRYELARRFAIYYTATAISGAFSGLLAGLITGHLDGARGLQGWQWLFLIEGVGSSSLGFFTWYILPDWPATTKWLTPDERILAASRLAYDGLGATQGAAGHVKEWDALKMVFKDWRSYGFCILYMLVTGAQTIQYFVPTLVSSMGYKGVSAQYHTIPLYATAFVFILSFNFASDYYKNKANFITAASAVGTVCFIVVVTVQSHIVKYVFICFAFGAIYALPPLVLMWVPNVLTAPAQKRAVAIALVNGLGNTASIYGVFLWPSTDAPRYIPGFAATTLFMFVIGVGAQVMQFLIRKYPTEQINAEETIRLEIEKQRARGVAI